MERFAEARLRAEEGHRSFPRELLLADALARLLSASPDAKLRDGPRALALARRNFESRRIFEHVVTLAMAHAEAGDFERAMEWQERAIKVAQRAGHAAVVETLREELEGYATEEPSRRPWR